MLHVAKNVLESGFLEKTINGLLLIFDEHERTTHLGWILEARRENGSVSFELGLSVIQKHGENRWDLLEKHSFQVPIETFTAMDHGGGFHCTDPKMEHPTFKVYPKRSIPPECKRTHENLIKYGDALR